MFGGPWTYFGQLILLAEGRWWMRHHGAEPPRPARRLRGLASVRVQTALVCGLLLYMFLTYMSEWDLGIAQYPLAEHPVVILTGAAVSLVIARSIGGRGAALGAAVTVLVLRGVYTAIVAGPLHHSAQAVPLLIAEALLVEVLAVWLGTRRPLRLGLASGAAIGTLGLAAEGLWSQVGLPWGWPVHMVVGYLPLFLAAALGGGLLGALVVAGLRRETRIVDGPRAIALAAVGILAPVAAGAIVAQNHPPNARVAVALSPAKPPRPPKRAGERWVHATIRVIPASAAKGADWFHVVSWNGDEPVIRDGLRRIGPDAWRTTKAIPASAPWKSIVRINRGHVMGSAPIFMPYSKLLKAKEVPASPRFERPFVHDMRLLQREREQKPPMWLWNGASAAVFAWMAFLFAMCAVLLRRFARGVPDDAPARAPDRGLPLEAPLEPNLAGAPVR
jgi:hypothetical protein